MHLSERIPEPELMDSRVHARAYAAADFSEPHDAFVARFAERFPEFVAGRVLDLGCGTADVTIRFARAYPQARVLGIDGARAMLELGERAVRDAGSEHAIRLELMRLPASDVPTGFDAVISNSLLHHLADPAVMWDTVRTSARRGGIVFVMDLRRPATTEEAQRLVDTYAADESDLLRVDFFASLCAAYTGAEIDSQLQHAGLALAVEAVGDRHVCVWGRTSAW